MNFSNALPIQFWESDTNTFNETNPEGVFYKAFYHPWKCSDTLNIQFSNDTDLDLSIIVLNTDGVTLHEGDITSTLVSGQYVFTYSLNFEENDICDQMVQIVIGGYGLLIDSTFPDYTGWAQTVDGNESWLVPTFTIRTKTFESPELAVSIPSATLLNIITTLSNNSAGVVTVKLYQSAGSAEQSVSISSSDGDNYGALTTTAIYDKVSISAIITNQSDFTLDLVRILSQGVSISPPNNTFTGSLSPWTQHDDLVTDREWIWATSNQAVVLMGSGSGPKQSKLLRGVLSSTVNSGDLTYVTLNFQIALGSTRLFFDIYIGGVLAHTFGPFQQIGNYSESAGVTSGATSTQLDIVARVSGGIPIILLDDITIYQTTEYALDDFSLWSNTLVGEEWTEVSGSAVIDTPGPLSLTAVMYDSGITNKLTYPLSIQAGVAVSYYIEFLSPSASPDIDFYIRFRNGTSVIEEITSTALVQDNVYILTGQFTSDDIIDRVTIEANNNNSGEFQLKVQKFELSVVMGSLRSDMISVKENQDETVLIEYSNTNDFAGIIYENQTPEPEFSTRIPAVFFHSRYPQEQEVIELSNSRKLQLNSELSKQKRLDTGHMPDYMHEKVMLILQHDNVIINDVGYLKEEAYELADGNKRFPLKRASCWLTQKDYQIRNVI